MILQAWRIVKTKRASTAFSGEGARLYGGRWSSPGRSVVYLSSSISLALLEVLVHLDSSPLLAAYSLIRVDFDQSLVERLDKSKLPENWASSPAPIEAQEIGDLWIKELRSPVLTVPSAIVRQEDNYLLNPMHPEFHRITIGEPSHFELDFRL